MNYYQLKKKKLMSVLFAGTTLLFCCLYGQQVLAQDPYANGNTIIIGTGSGQQNFENGIFGGSESGTINATNITVSNTAAYFANIYGGNKTGTITGTSQITIDGKVPYDWKTIAGSDANNTTAYYIYGGNKEGGSVGNVQLTINNGWIYGVVVGGGVSTVENDVRVDFNKGLIGSPPEYKSGHGEIYAGVEGINNVVKGNTYLNISGNSYNPNSYIVGNNDYTVIRQHALGGGYVGGSVNGNTNVTVTGGSIFGHVTGGGGGGNGTNENQRSFVGNTFVKISGGEIGVYKPDNNGGNVYGGGYSGPNDVLGNTNVHIYGSAKISGSVYGGGQGMTIKLRNTVSKDANVLIENGTIGGNIYAGGSFANGSIGNFNYGSMVAGNGTVTLKGITSDNTFANSFKQSILPGFFSGTNSQSTLTFDNYQTDFLGKAGDNSTSGLFTNLQFINSANLSIDPANNYYAKNWLIETGSTINIKNTASLQKQETFRNAGTLSLNRFADLVTLTIPGTYTSLANGVLSMKATCNTGKGYLIIAGTAKKESGNSTTIALDLCSSWDGNRIDLVEAAEAGSDVDAFVMQDIQVNGKTATLKYELINNRIIWYIGTDNGNPDNCPECPDYPPIPAGGTQDPYANGYMITIGKNAGQYDFQQGIHGGAENKTIESTNLCISNTANYFETIYGGNNTGTITGTSRTIVYGKMPCDLKNATIDDNNFMTAYHLFGGNKNGGSIGSVDLTIGKGWIYGNVISGGNSIVENNVSILFSGGLIGSLPEFKSGQGELYAGVTGIGNRVKGNTYLKVTGNSYNPNAIVTGCNNDYTIVRQHVLGGGNLGGLVMGNTYVNIEGGSVFGHVTGGGGGGSGEEEIYRASTGNTFVTITGGEIGIHNPDNNGGNVYGGGYSGPNDILGNTNVLISENARIAGSIVGAGQAQIGLAGYRTKLPNKVYGNAYIVIENGTINGNIYAAGMIASGLSGGKPYGATVEGNGIVTLKGIMPDNTFATTFKQSILPGYFSGTASTSTLIFDNYQTSFLGKVGSSTNSGAFTNIQFINSSIVDTDVSGFYAKNWEIAFGSTLNIQQTATLQDQETFVNAGILSLGTSQVTLSGNYTSETNALLKIDVTSNTEKGYLDINGSAKKSTGSTSIDLNLSSSWNGERINLVEAAETGSDADAFTMNEFIVGGKTAVLANEVKNGKRIWYVGDKNSLAFKSIETDKSNITISQNPVSVGEDLTIFSNLSDNEFPGSINLFHYSGKKILTSVLEGKETSIKMPTQGVYILQTTTKSGISKTFNIIVK